MNGCASLDLTDTVTVDSPLSIGGDIHVTSSSVIQVPTTGTVPNLNNQKYTYRYNSQG